QHEDRAENEVGRRQAGERDQRPRTGEDDADVLRRSRTPSAADRRTDGRRTAGSESAAHDHARLRRRREERLTAAPDPLTSASDQRAQPVKTPQRSTSSSSSSVPPTRKRTTVSGRPISDRTSRTWSS